MWIFAIALTALTRGTQRGLTVAMVAGLNGVSVVGLFRGGTRGSAIGQLLVTASEMYHCETPPSTTL